MASQLVNQKNRMLEDNTSSATCTIPIVADEKITFLQDSIRKIIQKIKDPVYDQNFTRYKSPSNAELASDILIQSLISLVQHSKLLIEDIVATHYEDESHQKNAMGIFTSCNCVEQIQVVITGTVEQMKILTKPYLATSPSFDFYK